MSYIARLGLAISLSLLATDAIAATAVHGKCYELFAANQFDRVLPVCKQEAIYGSAEAQAVLGSMYREGDGVTQDYSEAMKWYDMAAEQGNAYAQHSLGELFYHQAHNKVLALKWFILAAKSGNAYMLDDRERFSKKMTVDQVAEAQRLALEFSPMGQ